MKWQKDAIRLVNEEIGIFLLKYKYILYVYIYSLKINKSEITSLTNIIRADFLAHQ